MPRKITIPATVRRYYRDYGSLSLCEPSRTRGEKKKKKRRKREKKEKGKKKFIYPNGSRRCRIATEACMNYSARSMIRLVIAILAPFSTCRFADKLDRINGFQWLQHVGNTLDDHDEQGCDCVAQLQKIGRGSFQRKTLVR